MKFKTGAIKEQYKKSPAILKLILDEFENLSMGMFHVEPVITRLTDAVQSESGVHLQNRAADIRDEFNGKRFYTDENVKYLVDYINHRYARCDGKKTLIHHSFSGGPLHFHFQVPALSVNLLLNLDD